MVKRTVLEGIIVHRNGKSVTPPLHQPFDFTADEVKELNKLRPQAISTQLVVEIMDEHIIDSEAELRAAAEAQENKQKAEASLQRQQEIATKQGETEQHKAEAEAERVRQVEARRQAEEDAVLDKAKQEAHALKVQHDADEKSHADNAALNKTGAKPAVAAKGAKSAADKAKEL